MSASTRNQTHARRSLCYPPLGGGEGRRSSPRQVDVALTAWTDKFKFWPHSSCYEYVQGGCALARIIMIRMIMASSFKAAVDIATLAARGVYA